MAVFNPGSPELIEYLQRVASRNFEKVKHALYDKTVSHAQECAAHGVHDRDATNPFIRKIIDDLRPNESEDVKRHRIANFNQCTFANWGRAKTALGKMFNPKLYKIDFPEWPRNELESLEGYLLDLPGELGSLENFVREQVLDACLIDPNAVVALFPDPSTVGIPEQFIKPIPRIYKSDRVIDYISGSYYLIWDFEKSDIGTPERPDLTGNILYLFDDTYIHKITQERPDKPGEFKYRAEVVMPHGMKLPPVVDLPGLPKSVEGKPMRESFFSYALPDWKTALLNESDLRAVTVRNAHPKEWRFKQSCPSCHGSGHVVSVNKGLPHNGSCEACGGSGDMNNRLGPAGIMLIKPDKTGEFPTGPFGGYINPDPAVLGNLRSEVEYYKKAGMAAIHMEDSMTDTRAGESGEAKKIDRDDQKTFFKNVADGVFRAWEFLAWYIAGMRYSGVGLNPDDISPDIKPPSDFDLETIAELAAKSQALKTSGVSPSIVAGVEKGIIRKEYQDQPEEAARLMTIAEVDPLPGLSGDEMLTRATYTREIDLWVHTNISRLVDQAIEADQAFLYRPLKERREAVYAIAKAEMPMKQGAIPLMGEEGMTDVDIEAESRAKLKGTVGGVQGILEVQKSVSEGVTQYDAGIAILVSIYGFDDAKARTILGKPVDLRQTKEKITDPTK